MKMSPTSAGRIIMAATTIASVVVYQFVFAAKCSPKSALDLIYPPSVAWVGCFVVGVVIGEAVRRLLTNAASKQE